MIHFFLLFSPVGEKFQQQKFSYFNYFNYTLSTHSLYVLCTLVRDGRSAVTRLTLGDNALSYKGSLHHSSQAQGRGHLSCRYIFHS